VRSWASDHGYDIGNIGKGTADNHPAQMINWYDCIKWCNAKSEMEGLVPVYTLSGTTYKVGESAPKVNTEANGYRLPSEEEWEWAARGGVKSRGYKYSGSDDLNVVGWVSDNSDARTHEVGKKQANELGVYDMTGNVWEWFFALNGANYRRIRGGGWDCSAFWCPVARSDGNGTLPTYRVAIVGFRLARSAVTPAAPPFAAPTPAPLSKDDMVLVEGGTLPDASELAGKSLNSFYIGRTEVTWLEWKKVRNWAADNGYDIGNVGAGSGNDHPVRDVSWYDCVKWCNARSEMEGLEPVYQVKGKLYRSGEYGKDGANMVTQGAGAGGYRLPSETEWEWAARGGVKSRGYKYSGSDDLNAVGWHLGNSKGAEEDLGSVVLKRFAGGIKDWTAEQKALVACGTFRVAEKVRNELDLRDMSGNVWEWCGDLNGTLPRLRGGSWTNNAGGCAVSYRYSNDPYFRVPDGGFRLARSAGSLNR
jgi:formylglycine-generating enzyme required for sulfatase activity